MQKTREEWLETRRSGVGASESAAVLGLNPWRGALEVYASKVGEHIESTEETEAQEMGHALEPVLARMFAADLGFVVRDLGATEIQRRDPLRPWLLATLDRVIVGREGEPEWPRERWGILEIKTTNERAASDWEDAAPLWVQVQQQHQFAASEWKWGYAAVLIGGQRRRYFRAQADAGFIDTMLLPALEKFWACVQSRTPPTPPGPGDHAAAIRSLFPHEVGGREVRLAPALDEADRALSGPREKEPSAATQERMQALLELAVAVGVRPAIKALEAEEKQLTDRIKLAIGDAEIGRLSSGACWTYKTVERKGYEVKPFAGRELRRRDPK